MNDFPLVSLGQGDHRRELRPSDIAKKGLVASLLEDVMSLGPWDRRQQSGRWKVVAMDAPIEA